MLLSQITKSQQQSDSIGYVADSVRVILLNESEIVGILDSSDKKFLYVKTELLGNLQIFQQKVEKIYHFSDRILSNSQDWLQKDISKGYPAFQYSILPSAIPIKRKTLHYQNLLLIGNYFVYGVSPYLSLGGILILYPLSIILQPKIQIPINKSNNLLLGTTLPVSSDRSLRRKLLHAYGVYTIGDERKNFSASYIYQFNKWEYSAGDKVGIAGKWLTEKYRGASFELFHERGRQKAVTGLAEYIILTQYGLLKGGVGYELYKEGDGDNIPLVVLSLYLRL